jgi:KDO2-lipid IV(A) lauroyltransferase
MVRFLRNKKFKKALERWLGRNVLHILYAASRLMKPRFIHYAYPVMGDAAYLFLVRHRRMALNNLKLVYKDQLTPAQRKEITRSVFRFIAHAGCELLYFYTHGKFEKIDRLVRTVEGRDNLDAAIKQGRGVVGISGHLGNFVMFGSLLNKMGYENTAIMRPMRDSELEKIFVSLRNNVGQNFIHKFPSHEAVNKSLAWLKQGKILIMYIDQRSGRGPKVDFLGVPTHTPTGAAVFALKSQAPVLPMFNLMNNDGTYRVIFGKEVPVIRSGNFRKDVVDNTIRFNQIIGDYIKKYPRQWFWFHDRWKR